jgi:hypothetical protein
VRFEQLVQADEMRALDVPVGVLGLHGQIAGVGQQLVEQLRDPGAAVLLDIDTSRFDGLQICFGHMTSPLQG